MFIIVTYKDAAELSTIRRNSSEIDLSVERTVLVNPKSPVRVMLEYIRKVCKLGIYTNFDLCDESGTLKGLFQMPTYEYATDLFQNAKEYYVIVLRTENDKRLSIIPQLNWENKLNADLKTRVRNYILTGTASPMTSSGGASKSSGGKKKK